MLRNWHRLFTKGKIAAAQREKTRRREIKERESVPFFAMHPSSKRVEEDRFYMYLRRDLEWLPEKTCLAASPRLKLNVYDKHH